MAVWSMDVRDRCFGQWWWCFVIVHWQAQAHLLSVMVSLRICSLIVSMNVWLLQDLNIGPTGLGIRQHLQNVFSCHSVNQSVQWLH